MENHEFIENNLLILSKQTFEIFLNQEYPADVMSLYLFYYYTAKWQETNRIKATTGYAAKGLKWPEARVRQAKKCLIALGIIEDITQKDEISKLVVGWYIKVKYIWNIHPNEFVSMDEKTTLTKIHSVENHKTNALFINNINALDKDIKTSDPVFLELSNHLKELMLKNNPDAKITEKQIKDWSNDVRLMIERDKRTPAKIKVLIDWAQGNNFWKTNILSMGTLREKFDRLTLQMGQKSGGLVNRERGLEYKVRKAAANV